ncbi:hypothetical protein [Anaerosporobacter faecicola]|nr:hypothetical protein [Anaerosporobacter faecicola]
MDQVIQYINDRIEQLRKLNGKETIGEKELLKVLEVIDNLPKEE